MWRQWRRQWSANSGISYQSPVVSQQINTKANTDTNRQTAKSKTENAKVFMAAMAATTTAC
ncbi:MAG: hypothetical protein LCI00_33805 [Chloroflexi bacterium]|nr:hypothetical protein [Chloroflexota bacterium]